MNSEPGVLVEREGGVATIVLNRPDRRNAIGGDVGDRLDAAFAEVAGDASIRAVILTGSGGNFCVGGDVERLSEILADGGTGLVSRHRDEPATLAGLPRGGEEYRTRYLLPAAIGKPVVAAIEGICAGAGLVLAMACDLRVAAGGARFAGAFAQRGLVAENALTHLIERVGGVGLAARLLIAAEVIDGTEAHRCGLVEFVAAPGAALTQAKAIAKQIAETVSPRSAAIIKRQIQAPHTTTVATARGRDFDLLIESIGTGDFKEGLLSFREKRPPVFNDWQEQDQ